MKNRRNIFLGIVFLFVLFFGITSESQARIKFVKFRKQPKEIILGLKESKKLSIRVRPVREKKEIIFKTNRPQIVKVSSKGKITGRRVGSANVYAKAADGSKKRAKVKVRVIRKVKSVKLLNSQKSRTVKVNTTFAIQAAVLPKTATRKSLDWTSSSSSVAAVSSNGVVTARNGGTATITAKATDGTGKRVSCKLKVVVPVLSIQITEKNNEFRIEKGAEKSLQGNVYPTNATEKSLLWKSSNTEVAVVDSNGFVYGKNNGTAVITATALDGSGVSSQATVTVISLEKTDTNYIAHRGLSGQYPENTYISYKKAVEAGFWGVECDLRETKDGEFVMMHDESLQRMCGIGKNVQEMTYAEIQELKVISGKGLQDYPNEAVATFDDYLKAMRNSDSYAVIEIKQVSEVENLDRVKDKVKEYGLESQTIYISANIDYLKYLREKDSECRLQAITKMVSSEFLAMCTEYKFDLSCDYRAITPQQVACAQKEGLEVSVWTVNDFYLMYDYIHTYKIDYLTTNYKRY